MIRCRYCSIYQLHILWTSQTFDLESITNFGKFSAIVSSAPFPPYSPSDVAVMHMTHLLMLSPGSDHFPFSPHSFSLSLSAWEVSFDPSSRLLGFPQLSSVYLRAYWRHSSFLLVFLIFSISVHSLDFPFLCLHYPSVLAFCLLLPLEPLLIVVILSSLPDNPKICYTWSWWFLQSVFPSFWHAL